ncbi:MAG: branched-chain amino acid transaminase [Thermoanaerobaculaceae bacterium]|nr:branched-chain amino acid transaminase [Thermoanaerobaculaceae bacterium]
MAVRDFSKKTDWICINGEFVKWDDAKIHIMSHVIHYGSSVFEGIRCYKTPKGPMVMRLKEHIQRLYNSAKIYRMTPDISVDDYVELCLETIRKNKMEECYIRPLIYRGYGDAIGVDPTRNPVDYAIMVWEWGKYLGEDALTKGVDVCVSSWRRMAPDTMPTYAKAGSNYMSSALIKMEAILNGYVEGIALDVNGFVSEGSGENLFIIKGGEVYTPPLSCSILPGITRDSVIKLFREDLKVPVNERNINREMLYVADELFFTGTAAEVSPIRSVDKIQIGNGARGPLTEKVQTLLLSILTGKAPDKYGWLTPVNK